MFARLGSRLFNVGLYIGLINTWLSIAGSRHMHTDPLGFGITVKLLHYLAISFTHSSSSISCSCSHSNSFWTDLAKWTTQSI